MNILDAIRACLRNYANFSGRARRAEFWWWQLFCFAASFVGSLFDVAAFQLDIGFFGGLFSLFVFVPTLAVGARRLHDTERSGWWLLLWLIPLIGWLALIIWWCERGTPGSNRYGDTPIPNLPGTDAMF